jgi:hypothetical protein
MDKHIESDAYDTTDMDYRSKMMLYMQYSP